MLSRESKQKHNNFILDVVQEGKVQIGSNIYSPFVCDPLRQCTLSRQYMIKLAPLPLPADIATSCFLCPKSLLLRANTTSRSRMIHYSQPEPCLLAPQEFKVCFCFCCFLSQLARVSKSGKPGKPKHPEDWLILLKTVLLEYG
jgi:hypothetical protein